MRIADRPWRGLTRGFSSPGALDGSIGSVRTQLSPVSAILVAEDFALLTCSWSKQGSEGGGGEREGREDEMQRGRESDYESANVLEAERKRGGRTKEKD